jgi:hypothetical protein
VKEELSFLLVLVMTIFHSCRKQLAKRAQELVIALIPYPLKDVCGTYYLKRRNIFVKSSVNMRVTRNFSIVTEASNPQFWHF